MGNPIGNMPKPVTLGNHIHYSQPTNYKICANAIRIMVLWSTTKYNHIHDKNLKKKKLEKKKIASILLTVHFDLTLEGTSK